MIVRTLDLPIAGGQEGRAGARGKDQGSHWSRAGTLSLVAERAMPRLTISRNSPLHDAQCRTPSIWAHRQSRSLAWVLGSITRNGLICAPH